MRSPGAASLALLVLLAPLASAQAPELGLSLERALDAALPVAPGEVVRLNLTLTNPTDDGLLVSVVARGPEGWNATALPASFDLPPRAAGEQRIVTLGFVVPERARPRVEHVALEVTAINSTTGALLTRALDVPVEVTHTALVLGLFQNPLPAPLDNAYGVFLLDLAVWAFIAGSIIVLQDPIVKFLTRRAERRVSLRIVVLLRVPMFAFLVFFGLTQSWRALPPSEAVDLGQRVFGSLYILVTMYLVYKVFRAVILYYIENIAIRTESQLDDILVPVLEKVGAVVIVLAGILYFISTLGIDLTAFVAGGVVVSMVLAFAAQDTLSNFFAGLFLMLDRPFVRGDDIVLVTGGPLAGDIFRVDQVGLRSTRLYHYKNHQIVVMPNNDLAKNPVVNMMYPDHRYRVHVPVGVAYEADVDLVQKVLEAAARAHPDVDSSPGFEPFASLDGFGDSQLDFVLLFYIKDVKRRIRIASDVRERILKDFAAEGIEIPFPQTVMRVMPGPTDGGGEGLPPGTAPGTPPTRTPDGPKRS
ncbi:MAG TPA: mechanosensitive ion channel domain-containing protein [Candidatus Thermoplasmatota archaeon]|jgi:small-conductance mechanosensitive channel|nr:mechanosensitive ion channel domain-containing protein [Candidatus Thermoplasmatota archaeon]